MKKTSKKGIASGGLHSLATDQNRLLLAAVAVVAVGYLGYISYGVGWSAYHNYRAATNLAQSEQIRELVLAAVNNLGAPAPVEPRTGDVYFPPAKLYLPAASFAYDPGYKYSWEPETQTLSVTDKSAIGQAAAQVTSARDVDEVFQHVPRLQACSRGVRISPQSEPSAIMTDGIAKGDIALANGKKLYIYIEKGCPANDNAAAMLAKLRAY